MIPVVVGGLRETSLVSRRFKIKYYQVCLVRGGKSSGNRLVSLNPAATTGINVPGKIIYYQVCLLRGGKSSGTKLVSLNPPTTTGIIRPRKDKILSGMFSKGR